MYATQNNTCPFFPIQPNLCLWQNRSDTENALMENCTQGPRSPRAKPTELCLTGLAPMHSWVSLQTCLFLSRQALCRFLRRVARQKIHPKWWPSMLSAETELCLLGIKEALRLAEAQRLIRAIYSKLRLGDERENNKCVTFLKGRWGRVTRLFRITTAASSQSRPSKSLSESSPADSQILIIILIKHASALDKYTKVMGKNINCIYVLYKCHFSMMYILLYWGKWCGTVFVWHKQTDRVKDAAFWHIWGSSVKQNKLFIYLFKLEMSVRLQYHAFTQ